MQKSTPDYAQIPMKQQCPECKAVDWSIDQRQRGLYEVVDCRQCRHCKGLFKFVFKLTPWLDKITKWEETQ